MNVTTARATSTADREIVDMRILGMKQTLGRLEEHLARETGGGR